MDAIVGTPTSDLDFWSEQTLRDPYPVYEELHQLGEVVWLERHQAYALTSHEAVRTALTSTDLFTSAHGCMMNEEMNTATKGIMLCSDGEQHLSMRRLFGKPLTPRALKGLTPRFEELARDRVRKLVLVERFDAVAHLASLLPVAVIAELVGLDDEGGGKMLYWANGIFEAFGPAGYERTAAGVAIANEVVGYVLEKVKRENLVAGGWGEALFVAADEGRITEQTARLMLIDYLTPSLDTTIHAISAAVHLFSRNPDQWTLLRHAPGMMDAAIDEILRIESPIRAFSRLVCKDIDFHGTRLIGGRRALVLYACANRDPSKYVDPSRFDIARAPTQQLAFGAGPHICAGLYLARLEMKAILGVMLEMVSEIRTFEARWAVHNTLRGLERLETAFLA
jgi:cytochrome P450